MTRLEELRAKQAAKKLANPFTKEGFQAKLKQYGFSDELIEMNTTFDTISEGPWTDEEKKAKISEELTIAKKVYPAGRSTQDEF